MTSPSVSASESLVFGRHAAASVLARDPAGVLELWLQEKRHDVASARLLEMAAREGIAVHRVARATLDRMVQGGRHQGVVLRYRAAAPLPARTLEEVLGALAGPPFLLLLDGVQDPHNLGACLRSADAAGVHAVIVPKDRAAGMTPVVRKVASGAAEAVPLVQVTNLARTLEDLARRGVFVVGAAGDAETLLYDADLSGPLALVLGGEEKGLRRLTRAHCDVLVRIPMAGAVSSLNVSVAAGVCLFEACRQRRAPSRRG